MIYYGDAFRDSCRRVVNAEQSRGGFFDVFYDRFIGSSPVIAAKFEKVDMKTQKNMLRESLAVLLELFATKQIPPRLREIARRHDRDHADIEPSLYDVWQECLLATVRDFDPEFNDDVELAWRLVCSQGIAYMSFMYAR